MNFFMAEKSLVEEIKELIALGVSPDEASKSVREERRARRAHGKTVVRVIYCLILRCVQSLTNIILSKFSERFFINGYLHLRFILRCALRSPQPLPEVNLDAVSFPHDF